MAGFSFADGAIVSVFSMMIVFLVLIFLAFIISMFKYLPQSNAEIKSNKKKALTQSQSADNAPVANGKDGLSNEVIAFIVASCLEREKRHY